MERKHQKREAVFTPGNEPYLGRETVLVFDQLIVAALKDDKRVAALTRKIQKSELQEAACQLIPAGFSLALSIRELVRQGYLYGALVLIRPLAERAATILYLSRFPDKQALWTSGWNYKERPSLANMLTEIGASQFPNCGPEITRSLNSVLHGDPASAMWNLVKTGEDSFGHAVSKILNRPDLCDKVGMDAAMWMSVLLAMREAIFPQLEA